MYIERLTLKDYRNYNDQTIHFSDKVNVIIGQNAQGKTNLVEAILMLAIAKSHRTNSDKELIKFDAEFARIEGRFYRDKRETSLELMITNAGKKAKVNRLEQKKLSSFVGELHVVFFAPEDLSIVKGSPQIRRRFIDIELGQLSAIYIHELNQYQKTLLQRNSYLKQKLKTQKLSVDDVMLDVLEEQLATVGTKIYFRRKQFIERLEQWAQPIHTKITDGKEQFSIKYSTDLKELVDESEVVQQYTALLRKHREKDLFRGSTSIGPHRDDLSFYVNGRNMQQFGSQGQQRTVALSIKLAEIDLVYEMKKQYPVLILDDVLSELDSSRQTHLLNAIENRVQTFVTTTSVGSIQHETIQRAKVIYINDGNTQDEKS
ncbi:MAG: DNA replication/repair protein RecF [Bacilli bacterium]